MGSGGGGGRPMPNIPPSASFDPALYPYNYSGMRPYYLPQAATNFPGAGSFNFPNYNFFQRPQLRAPLAVPPPIVVPPPPIMEPVFVPGASGESADSGTGPSGY